MSKKDEKKQLRTGNSRSIFRRIIKPLGVLSVLDAVLLVVVLLALGVIQQLNQNSFDILEKQVDNRQGYLQSQMVNRWMSLDDLAGYINGHTEKQIREGRLNLDILDSKPSACAPLVMEVMDRMISEMYAKQVSGIYVVFNTHDLRDDEQTGNQKEKTGVYIRDNDPLSASSEKYADLLLECSPVSVVQSLSLSTDSTWEQKFKFGPDHPYGDWLTIPYSTATEKKLKASECGYWGIHQDAAGNNALSYTVPLILSDGKVYGVLGVDVLPGYLRSQMPASELNQDGIYALFVTDRTEEGETETGTMYRVGNRNDNVNIHENMVLRQTRYGGYSMNVDGIDYEVALNRLSIYSRNAPFEQQRWYLMGAVPRNSLHAFTTRVQWILGITVVLMLSLGFACALFTGWHIARPVVALRKELEAAGDDEIPQLSQTGITEVDDFAGAITDLSRDVVNSSRRFLSIMEMSSIDMGGYELDEDTGFLFTTDNFFTLLGYDEEAKKPQTVDEFRARMAEIERSVSVEEIENGKLYTIRYADESEHYIHIQETRPEHRYIGVAEDVTKEVLERRRIEYERDHDILTGLMNRRAFYRDAQQMLRHPETLGTTLIMLLDLDNLKALNDTYGHEWGDKYIRAGAQSILDTVSEKSLVARVSGDSFNLLLYGFTDRRDAMVAVEKLQRSFNEAEFVLPDGKVQSIGASGGVAFAFEDANELKQLIKYADFAMYTVKHSRKGFFGVFDRKQYHASEIEQMKHRAFKRIVSEEQVRYVFQPIVDAGSGDICAVEALMRVKDPDIANTEEFLRIARQEQMLDQVEHMTWHHALMTFQKLIHEGTVNNQTKLFINSQVSQIMNPAEQKQLIEEFGDIRANTVMEVVETDDYSVSLCDLRDPNLELFAGEFALDDFGTGYNSEKNLLELMPRYVKLDMSLVRNLEKHTDRQKLIEGLINFAHEKDMLVLAEGVETKGELLCLLDMHVDLLQGYLLAKPSDCPDHVDDEAVAMIREKKSRG